MSEAVAVESPLFYQRDQRGVNAAGAMAGVSVQEIANDHLILRGDPDSAEFAAAVQTTFGVPLPGVCQMSEGGSCTVCWMGPDEFLALVPQGEALQRETAFRGVASGHIAVVDVSSGQTRISLRGEAVGELLQKSSVYDFHPANFPAGRCVQTTFAKTTALAFHTGEGIDLVVRRSFGDYIAQWILDAATDVGCELQI